MIACQQTRVFQRSPVLSPVHQDLIQATFHSRVPVQHRAQSFLTSLGIAARCAGHLAALRLMRFDCQPSEPLRSIAVWSEHRMFGVPSMKSANTNSLDTTCHRRFSAITNNASAACALPLVASAHLPASPSRVIFHRRRAAQSVPAADVLASSSAPARWRSCSRAPSAAVQGDCRSSGIAAEPRLPRQRRQPPEARKHKAQPWRRWRRGNEWRRRGAWRRWQRSWCATTAPSATVPCRPHSSRPSVRSSACIMYVLYKSAGTWQLRRRPGHRAVRAHRGHRCIVVAAIVCAGEPASSA